MPYGGTKAPHRTTRVTQLWGAPNGISDRAPLVKRALPR